MSDVYDVGTAVPNEFNELEGPKGLGLIRVWPDGRTDKGWGFIGPKDEPDNGFMPRYLRGEFNERRVLFGYERDKWAFAFIMRSVQLMCIDIDGKNGGLEHAKRLGALPPTMAETSKSGDGFHLFYLTTEQWDPVKGFALLGDRVGIEQGVDIRGTGCVYHHKQQRWNQRIPAKLPDYMVELLHHRDQRATATHERIDKVLANQDELEVLMLHDEILSDLKKPIPQGKRNVTLFALGNQMRQARVPEWEDKLAERGTQVGLPDEEIEKLVENIQRYGSPVVP
jgi:hypothetical protein